MYAPIVRETAISFEESPPTVEEMADRIGVTLESFPWLVCDEGRVAGYAYAGSYRSRGAYRWSAETTVYVSEDHRRQGLAAALYTSLLALLELQGFRTALAGITQPNEASVSIHERLGFKPIGIFESVGFKLGDWRDVGWWRRPLGDSAPRDRPPLPLAQARAHRGWPTALATGQAHLA
ncbi:MAG: GNAT family N-acetyltransferase [Acidobacteriota bacterium]|nr:GNAT family N-acetyltransferase [Acidobacteriota bacterium]